MNEQVLDNFKNEFLAALYGNYNQDDYDTYVTPVIAELTAAQARITELETALQNLVNFDDKNYYQRVHITQEPEVMKQARAALEVKP